MLMGKKYRPLITKTLLSGRTLEARADGAKIVKSGLWINFFASLQGNYDVLLYCMLLNYLCISFNSSKYYSSHDQVCLVNLEIVYLKYS